MEKIEHSYDQDAIQVLEIPSLPKLAMLKCGSPNMTRLQVDGYEALEELVDVYTRSFRNTLLIGQSAAPWLIEYACRTRPCPLNNAIPGCRW